MSSPEAEYAPRSSGRSRRWAPVLACLATFAVRLIGVHQPIAENYVGRQVPTAMVARNLERGSGFLHPQLDTAPFPNLFVVEPPVYEALVVAIRKLTALDLPASGRITSALATALAAWGLYELIRRRDGERVAIAAMVAFSLLPVTLRYGRSFQPDALMLGATLAGLACWDRSRDGGTTLWLVAGGLLLALGIAAKITAALVLAPLMAVVIRPRRAGPILFALSTLVPVLLWYAWANHLMSTSAGSRASVENRAIWMNVTGLAPWAARQRGRTSGDSWSSAPSRRSGWSSVSGASGGRRQSPGK